ncbi:transporter substrate-binding domain-containing protein [Pigmentibacter sp. JX0631]|uniref:substrate-binding periplasmic protein n=1 Tax=Pigmentibacter sp. JX0631 TaxID=2976982 RepID=UPI00246941CC|nr:transporter substrate-binding domain-containing protein [Pigmentibacter sp. JX0631]WGL58951.1 transporter substrate-binding domain-containing protein [Pigmentibacter sp. JX0631]
MNFIITKKCFANEIQDFKIVTETLPFLTFIGKDGKTEGVLADRINKLRKNLKIKAEIELLPWSRAYIIAQKENGTMIYPIAKTPEREKLFKFCCILYKAKTFLFKLKERSDINIKTLEDAKKYSIGVIRDDIKHKMLENLKFTNLELSASQEVNFKKLIGKREDLIIANEFVLKSQLQEFNINENELEKAYEVKEADPNRYIAFNLNVEDSSIEKIKSALKKIYNPDLD